MYLILIILAFVFAVFLIFKTGHFRPKLWAIFAVLLLLFLYVSYSLATKDAGLDFSLDGIGKGAGLYLSWLGSAFGNFKVLMGHAVNLDWDTEKNDSTEDVEVFA